MAGERSQSRSPRQAGGAAEEPKGVQVEDQVDAMGWGRFQWIATTTFILFIISDGMELVVTNITFRAMPREVWGMHEGYRGYLVSCSFVGFVGGAILGGYFGDNVGRKAVIYAHSAIFIPFALASAFANSAYALMVTRLFVGVAMGLLLPTAVAFMSELCPTHMRGRLIPSLPGAAYTLGQILVLSVGMGLIYKFGESEDSHWWRYMMAAGVVPNFIGLVLLRLYVPESPRYLAVQGKTEEVTKALKHMAEINGAEDALLDGGRVSIPDKQETEVHEKVMELFEPPLRDNMVFIIVTWCLLALPLMGQSYMYPILLEKQFNVSAYDQYMMLIQLVSVEIVGLIICFLFIDNANFGRKRTVMMFAAASIVFGVFAACVSGMSLGWVHASQMLFKLATATPYEIMYVYAAELLPTTHRNQGVSIGNSMTKVTAGVFLPLVLTVMLDTEAPAEAARNIFIGFVASSVGVVLTQMYFGRETVGRKMLDLSTEKPGGVVQECVADRNGYQTIGETKDTV